jgi:hypothetical protein
MSTLTVGQKVRIAEVPEGWESAVSIGDTGRVVEVDPSGSDKLFIDLDGKPVPDIIRHYIESNGLTPGWPLLASEVESVE